MAKDDPKLRGLEDLELIDRFKRCGDNRYFEEVFNCHSRTIFRMCHHLLRSRDMAEDMTQQTFERALREIGYFECDRDNSNVEHWLKTIAKNICIDERRAERRKNLAVNVGELERFQGTSVNAVANLTLREILEVLDSMEERYRICYLLKIEGYSYEEIAEEAGFSLDEVKTYIRTAQRWVDRRFKLGRSGVKHEQ